VEEQLSRLIQAGDPQACAAFFAPLDEKARRELRAAAAALEERASRAYYADSNDEDKQRRHRCARLAVIATATWGHLRRAGLWPHHLGHLEEHLSRLPSFQVLRDRRPPWLPRWAAFVCEDEWMASVWPALRDFELEGLVERPAGDGYYRAMVRGYGWVREGLASRLAADPELLEHHVFKILEIEVVPGDSWREALVELAETGAVDRARLLDACLDGLERDFDHQQAAWIRRLHDQLEPTAEELASRTGRYRSLLASRNPSTVDLALSLAGRQPAASAEAARDLLRQLEPVLVSRAKTTARRGLRLLKKTARGQPALAGEVGMAATAALLHESPEVQHAALDLIETLGLEAEPAIARRLEEFEGTLSPTVAARRGAAGPAAGGEPADGPRIEDLRERAALLPPRIRERAGVDSALGALADGGLPPPLDLRQGVVPRLDPAGRIEPILELDELFERAAALLEGERTAAEIDCALDGISRLCDRRPADFDARSAPLRKLARERVGGRIADLPLVYSFDIDFSLLLLAWIEGVDFGATRRRIGFVRWLGRQLERLFPPAWELPAAPKDCSWIFSRYVEEIGRRVARRQAAPLLALPTHQGGWIDPRVLVERLLVATEAPAGALDLVLAFLRLAPEHRDEALVRAVEVPGEVGRAFRYALGGSESVGRPEVLWVAAARSRGPREDDPEVLSRFGARAPGAGLAPRPAYALQTVKLLWEERLTVAVEHPGAGRRRLKPELASAVYTLVPQQLDVPWACHVWPHDRDPLWVGAACSLLARDQGHFEGCREAIEVLLDPDEPVTEAACWLLGLALGRKQAEVRGLAVDILIAAFEDGRADPAALGRVMAGFHAEPKLVPQRWVPPLKEVAAVSTLHAESVRRTLEHALAGRDLAKAIRRLSAPLELLCELTVGLGEPIREAGCRKFLEAVPGKAKNAQRAAKILAVTGPGPERPEIAAAALAARLDRADRWTARLAP
jgi:hypothetical protein